MTDPAGLSREEIVQLSPGNQKPGAKNSCLLLFFTVLKNGRAGFFLLTQTLIFQFTIASLAKEKEIFSVICLFSSITTIFLKDCQRHNRPKG